MAKLTVREIQDHFGQRYKRQYMLNDSGHRENHFLEVQNLGLKINQVLGLGQGEDLITIVAWCHDMFAWDRDQHHNLAASWVYLTEDPIIRNLDDQDMILVAEACREHRASWKESFTSTLSDIMSAADRGMSSTKDLLRRSFEYQMAHGINLSENQGLQGAISHLVDKYGRGGYQRLSQTYLEFFEEELQHRYNEIQELSNTPLPLVWDWLNEP